MHEYCGIFVENNKKHHVSMVLNCACNSPSIDDYIKDM
jgi:hypothetical protein